MKLKLTFIKLVNQKIMLSMRQMPLKMTLGTTERIFHSSLRRLIDLIMKSEISRPIELKSKICSEELKLNSKTTEIVKMLDMRVFRLNLSSSGKSKNLI